MRCNVSLKYFNGNKMERLPIVRYHLRIFIHTLVLFQFFLVSSGISAQIELRVDGNGFHRNFTYHIQLNNFTNEENCQATLHNKLPTALYVNINELADLQRVGKIKICSIGETDVESFMENANSQNVTICTSLKNGSCTMTIPIHQRYLHPKEDSAYKDIVLKKPNLLIGCNKKIREQRVSKLNLCPLCATLAVKWREISYVMDNSTDYAWTIPMGDISLSPFVTSITLSTTVIGTIFLTKAIWKAPYNSSRKDN